MSNFDFHCREWKSENEINIDTSEIADDIMAKHTNKCVFIKANVQGPLLLTWFKFNHSMDK